MPDLKLLQHQQFINLSTHRANFLHYMPDPCNRKQIVFHVCKTNFTAVYMFNTCVVCYQNLHNSSI